ncbi:efflux RND transporter periplasmic adaptor subunit [Tepidibacillus sp. LV47]|uniref:efflux RND transporter periplasmic adaptor subunit n=1 Tax=Tepidibacillus sp. LV47 TaxID=3398228 RepID=UPI003AAD7A57
MHKHWQKFIAILLSTVIFAVGCSTKNGKEEGNQSIPVLVAKVERKTIENQDRYIGSIKAIQDVMVFSKITGKVEQVNVKIGDKVKEGQVLLKVDSSDLSYSVRQANISYQAALDNLERAEDGKKQAEEQVKQAEKAVNPLIPETQKALDAAKNALQAAEANVKAAQAQVNQAKVAVDQANHTISQANIKAPISGTISAVMVEKGEMATPQTPVIQIINTDTVIVSLNSITESSVKKFAVGQKVQAVIPSLNKTVTGTVTSVALAANPQTFTYPIEIQIENKDQGLKPGMLAEVILTQKAENQLVIPTKAILGTGEETYVFIIQNGKAVKKPVKIKEMSTEDTVIEGLTENDQVVIKGQYLLTDGASVRITTEEGKSS